MKKFIKIAVTVVVIAAAVYFIWQWQSRRSTSGVQYEFRTDEAATGKISKTISASGTVEPEELVNVGSQVTGKIMSFGKDTDGNTVDYRSYVKAGTLLAQIDDVLYAAALREAKAQKLQAEAAITSAEASIRQADARLNLAGINWKRAQELYQKKATSKSEYDSAEAGYISA